MNYHIIRLTPGEDLKYAITDYVNTNKIEAGWIATCVGSLNRYSIRFANQPLPSENTGFFEIISLSGTVSSNGCHLHISIAYDNGTVIGGHLMDGCKIYTTAEIVLVETQEFIFTREPDDVTKFRELKIKKL